MRNKAVLILVLLVIAGASLLYVQSKRKMPEGAVREVSPLRGDIKATINATGTVLPKNRLEIKPPVNGRVDEVLVKEGDEVKAAQIVAWMSSTERAALLDAAKGKGEADTKYWQDTYKPIPLISPIAAQVIVAKTQAGQTVTTQDAVVVLSDKLIIRAQIDETDIAKIKLGQAVLITLDAYPDSMIAGVVEHIYYESKTVNNVTIYEADVACSQKPQFLRSGMNASLDFTVEAKSGALLIPQEAIMREKDKDLVLLKRQGESEPIARVVDLGISDGKNTEVLEGLTDTDILIIKDKRYELPNNKKTTNPFMPRRR